MLYTASQYFLALMQGLMLSSASEIAMRFVPFALLLELPLALLVMLGMCRYAWRHRPGRIDTRPPRYPAVCCIITCYAEKDDVGHTLQSLAAQHYPGEIEIIAVVDGALQNADTLAAARRYLGPINALPRRRLVVLPKWQRGGRVSSLNAGRTMARGEIVMALDGDTSFDPDMVYNAALHFHDPDVIAVSGNLRVRNAAASVATRLQALEYLLSIGGGKTGLSEYNLVNNISGAFGVFRATVLDLVGGWDAGTAEDLDMTQRLKQYFGRHPSWRIVFDPRVVGHTDVPATFRDFCKQRLRWDGDLYYIFVRKYRRSLRPRLLGWRTFLAQVVMAVLLQLAMPFLILAYSAWLFVRVEPGLVLAILGLVYLAYLALLVVQFALYCLAVSDRPREDARYFLWLPLYPLFAWCARINSAVALLHEIFNRGHLDSAMAPWWVLRKTKF